MTFFNENGTARTATEESILLFVEKAVTRKKGSFIPAIALYGIFIKRTGADVHTKKFFRIVDEFGFRPRAAIGGDYYENLTFTEGE